MKYEVYFGLTDWSVTVEADSKEEALVKGKREFLERLNEGAYWWVEELRAQGKSAKP